MVESGVIDEVVLDDLLASVGGDTSFLVELINTYLSETPTLLAQLHTALAAQNTDEFRRAAHSLKSSSAGLGAHTLCATAKELEMMGKTGVLEGADEKLTLAEDEYARVQDELEKVKATKGG
ncbi:MAG: Hpt domain-containing protein [Chloroflexi bacterium]|nr:Hpt domain-containing protein [Chloroflexota bacterium]